MKFEIKNVKEFSWCPVNVEVEVSVSWHVLMGFKSQNLKKFGTKVLKMYYNIFRVETFK